MTQQNMYLKIRTLRTITAAGSEAAPSRTFTGQLDDGMWSPAAGKLAWSLGGSEKMRLNGNGLGIGTSNLLSSIGGLDISSGGNGLILGADNNVTTRTDTTTKQARFGMAHYTNAEQPVAMFLGTSASASSILAIGGGSSSFNSMTDITFYTAVDTITITGTLRMTINRNGLVGISESAPETLLEMTHAQPYITLHNETHEDTDGGRESKLIFKGEQSGGEETELAVLEVSHDGTSDDQLGKLVLSVNSGAGLIVGLKIDSSGGLFPTNLKSGTDQANASAAAGELYQDTNDDNTIKIGV